MIDFFGHLFIFLLNGRLHRLSVGFVVFYATIRLWVNQLSDYQPNDFAEAVRLSDFRKVKRLSTFRLSTFRIYGRTAR
jgi:hypothetical protein